MTSAADFERRLRREGRIIALLTIGGFVIVMIVLGWAFGDIIWNGTASMPRGFWRISPIRGAVRRGMIVSICPPDDAATRQAVERGYIRLEPACPSHTEPLLKYVLAVPGDRVRVSGDGLSVDGQLVPQTQSQPDDEGGRPMVAMPPGAYRVGLGEVWVYAPETLSWDSRYFGAVPIRNIKGQAKPVWTWK